MRVTPRAIERHALGTLDLAHAVGDDARRLGPDAEAGVPQPAGAREAHAGEVAAGRRVGRVEVGMRVEPQQRRARVMARQHRQRGDRDRALRREQDRDAPRDEGIVELPAGLEQAAVGVAQVVGPAAHRRLALRADDAGVEQLAELARAGRTGRRAVRRAAQQRDYLPVHRGSRRSRNAAMPSRASSLPSTVAQLGGEQLERVIERQVPRAPQSVLAEGHHVGGPAGDPCGPLADGRVELVVRDDAVDDPHPPRLVRVDALAEQQHLAARLRADVACQQRRHHERKQADVDLRRAERRALARRPRGRRRAPGRARPRAHARRPRR